MSHLETYVGLGWIFMGLAGTMEFQLQSRVQRKTKTMKLEGLKLEPGKRFALLKTGYLPKLLYVRANCSPAP
ncbi:MAG: hypothetical protein ACTSYI_15800 [Promethearchaeota archaeon]